MNSLNASSWFDYYALITLVSNESINGDADGDSNSIANVDEPNDGTENIADDLTLDALPLDQLTLDSSESIGSDSDGSLDALGTYYDYDGDGNNKGWLPPGSTAIPFPAIFNGNGFEMHNLYIKRLSDDPKIHRYFIGLFGSAGRKTMTTELRNIVLSVI